MSSAKGGPSPSEPARPRFAKALAIAAGRIVFVGDDAGARKMAGPETKTIDLGGRMVMPGIVDGHFHGTRLTDCHMAYEGGTVPRILARLQACLDRDDQKALKRTNARFNASYFFGDALEPAGASLTRYDLDRLDTTRPISIRNADGHKFWMNSRAIENARIDEKTKTPSGSSIGRDASGKPDGFFADYDAPDWGAQVEVTAAARLARVAQTVADAHRAGLTAVFIPGRGENEVGDWSRLQDEGRLTLRTNVGLSASFVLEATETAALQKQVDALAA